MKTTPPLLAITDPELPRDALAPWIEALAADGVGAVQLRRKDLDDRALFDWAREARRVAPPGLLIFLNGRLDIALAAGCDGVHLPADGPPLAALRRRFGAAPWIGVSTHHPDEVARSAGDGADYVTFGPVYPTPSKAAYGEPPGLAGLRAARAAAPDLPIFALGGIFPETLPEVARAGASGVAGIRTFAEAELRRGMVAGSTVFAPRETGP
jgi:thiamine-phosphate pyrophosphorylase